MDLLFSIEMFQYRMVQFKLIFIWVTQRKILYFNITWYNLNAAILLVAVALYFNII